MLGIPTRSHYTSSFQKGDGAFSGRQTHRIAEMTPQILDRLGAYFGLPAAPFDPR
jgi:hypothetical protein